MNYDPQLIEKKWQQRWEEEKPYAAQIDAKRPKYYVLDMFPYPSGAGLHVGHVTGYTASDIVSRYMRQKGYNVLHPMGWDSFGLPAEQYAVRTGTHPRETTKKNIETYKRQLKSLGFSYDWDRELATTDPDYYKWTQWIFTKLYEKGLAYEAEMLVNYCPALGTVLANEEVENGRAIEGGHLVERRPLKQWVLKITEYADRLLQDLEELDWPENVKQMQRNWIGRSEGAMVQFKVKDFDQSVDIYTTRQDTLFGVTFMVLSPEHPYVEQITTREQKQAVAEYQQWVSSKSDLERTELAKEKTGVWTGAWAIHPITNEEIPIWIADYVLMGYGTGAVMAVPSHDSRDFAFAKKFGLNTRTVIRPSDGSLHPEDEEAYLGEGEYVNSACAALDLSGMSLDQAKQAVNAWLIDQGVGRAAVNYKLRDWLFSRQRYWGEPFPILHFEDGTKRALELDELPLMPPELTDFRPSDTGESPLAKVDDWIHIQDPKSGKAAKRESNTMPQWAGSCWYFLRFCDPKNREQAVGQEADQYWMPVDFYLGGAEHAVTHLLYARFWHKVLYDLGVTHAKEPFKRYFSIGMVTSNAYRLDSGQYVPYEEVEKKGEAFFHKETGEPVQVTVEKMSKSKLNGTAPDKIVEELGADALRMYEVFMGPLNQQKFWSDEAVQGCHRFLSRVYHIAYSDALVDEENEEVNRLVHKMVHGVMQDMDKLFFNTAIAKMMEFLNSFSKRKTYPKSALKALLQALHPFAPHVTCELWEKIGETTDIMRTPHIEINKDYLVDDQVTYVIQVNGKVRAKFEQPKGLQKDELLKLAQAVAGVQKHIEGKELRKVIFVPDKLLNLVV